MCVDSVSNSYEVHDVLVCSTEELVYKVFLGVVWDCSVQACPLFYFEGLKNAKAL